MKHEGGHADYIAENTQAYLDWVNKNVKDRRHYDGHRKNDPSGRRAKEFEDRND